MIRSDVNFVSNSENSDYSDYSDSNKVVDNRKQSDLVKKKTATGASSTSSTSNSAGKYARYVPSEAS